MATDPDAMALAIEELLRAYSPVTMARVVTGDVEFHGCPMRAGDKVLMNFPAANRDPEVFEDPDRVVLDRTENRHVAFGSGIHRCAGSNLARMELRVALEEWLRRIPAFRLEQAAEVTWAGGQVRGPRVFRWCSHEDPGRRIGAVASGRTGRIPSPQTVAPGTGPDPDRLGAGDTGACNNATAGGRLSPTLLTLQMR